MTGRKKSNDNQRLRPYAAGRLRADSRSWVNGASVWQTLPPVHVHISLRTFSNMAEMKKEWSKSMMTPTAAVLVLWLLTYTPAPVKGYPNGKVAKACDSMMPRHDHVPQEGVVHDITVDKTTFKPGDHIKVTLSGPQFAGFFIQARDTSDLEGSAVGSFSLIDDRISQLMKCGQVQDSAVSQTSKRRKSMVEVYWIAPSNAPQHVQFLVTVVEKYSIFWVKIPGPVVSQTTPPPVIQIPNTAPLPMMPAKSALTQRFSSFGCGSSKFCVRNPTSCDPERDAWCSFLSFQKKANSMQIELSGPGKGYVAFALSHDQWMGDDDYYLCVRDGQTVDVNPAYTTGRMPPETAPPEVLQDIAWSVADGVLQCSFRRDIRIPSSSERFPLDGNYYIFLADGDAENGMIKRHHRQPLITSKMFNVSGSPKDVGGSRSPVLIKFHGAMMFLAWMTTVSIGVLVARFFKPVWPTSSLCGQKVWFQVHRMLMVTTVVLTAVAFVLPFLYRRKWSNRAGYHPYLGCVVMALSVLQPVMAIFRPPPHSPRRSLFNWTHWGGGTAARIIAVAAIFLGMDLQALELPDPWDTYTMVGFVLWHVCIDILLELHSFCLLRRESKIMEEDRVHILNPIFIGEKGHTFKKIVLTVYICGNFAFLITFLAAIYQL
ncbi:PREDICTED: ferric-chelate reductase 1 [Nanorana parkeri]|uniref:ferric-chelate reductase 1 n=1 Tax=Nanorana parkeri TaxID=125878 RepID=UPI0008544ACC|nr:PREDICTED: ferric-chelate reductase 1 [Nanorana parkeri]